uniref:C-type lectin domain-containing protein n=1 Tax=Poecilia reticulata TaxID=8081 RepID=A0A3P9PDA1_POERE
MEMHSAGGRWRFRDKTDGVHCSRVSCIHNCKNSLTDILLTSAILFVSALPEDSRCRLCPEGWLWWRRHCYFFSVGLQENRRWKESAEFCLEHNSSLLREIWSFMCPVKDQTSPTGC